MFTTITPTYGEANCNNFFHGHFPRPGEFKPQVSVGKNTETVEFIGVLWCPDVL